jgi:glycosyltransferase involved in cell wall biosynthesis
MTHANRVAIFTETFLPRVDGIVNTLKWSLRGLVEAGWQPLVVAPQGNTQTLPGVRLVGAPSLVFPLYPEVRLGYPTADVWHALDAFEPDLVHLAGPVTNGYGGLKYAQSRRLPVVSSYHTSLPEYARLYGLGWIVEWAWSTLRSVHNSTAVTLCPSRKTIADLSARGFERLALWSRGVDASLFSPRLRSSDIRARLGVRHGEALVMYVGRLAREKKLDRLAWALHRVDGVRGAIVGDGPDRARLEQVFGDLPVTFTGTLRGEELAAAYASADIFAFPSDTDTFGNVVLEAMACGVPIVACSVGGQVDLVRDGANGLLFEAEDTEQFAARIRQYRDAPQLRAAHAAEALRSARERTWPRQVDVLIHHYRAAIEQSTRTLELVNAA